MASPGELLVHAALDGVTLIYLAHVYGPGDDSHAFGHGRPEGLESFSF